MYICMFLSCFSNILVTPHFLKKQSFFKEVSSISNFMARNHQFRSHLFLNEFEMPTGGGGFNSLSRRNHREMYTSDVVNTLSDQFSSMSLLRPKPIPIPSLPSSLQVLFSSLFSV